VNSAVPDETGRGPPPDSVGFTGGFSWALVRVAVNTVTAET